MTSQKAKAKNSYAEESSYKPALSLLNPPASPFSSTSFDRTILSPTGLSPSSPKFHPTLQRIQPSAPSDGKKTNNKANCSLSENDSLPIYRIPKSIQILIKKDIAPRVLNRHLSPSSYSDYLAALLYAEEFYLQLLNMMWFTYVPLLSSSTSKTTFISSITQVADMTSTSHSTESALEELTKQSALPYFLHSPSPPSSS
ncbi:hypothetical protein TorRG33x02_130450 [Trema orientale]|uniref:Uncharacterized protein n=1 Tax=Trema orientale TaxID=63057 RepID=A0A2P5F0C6_TREOI|nr:hypothetical protein TorRG33x02_130450 [Trema orientale]